MAVIFGPAAVTPILQQYPVPQDKERDAYQRDDVEEDTTRSTPSYRPDDVPYYRGGRPQEGRGGFRKYH